MQGLQKLLILFLLFAFSKAHSQQNNKLRIRFFDEKTGAKVSISSIEISNEKFKITSSEKSDLNFSIPDGNFNIKVQSELYETILTNVSVLNKTETNIDFQLTRKVPIYETTFEYLHTNQTAEGILLTGFVTNIEDGSPLQNVKIFNQKNKISTNTNEVGFFKLVVPLSANANDLAIQISAKGFVTEIRKNYDAYPYGDLNLKIALKEGNTINTENVVLEREPALMLYNNNINYNRNYFQPILQSKDQAQIPDCVTSIKVGKTCACHNCSNGFDVINFNTYAANVVTSEWGQWGAWPNGIQSLNAGAVAIRSYALNRIAFPIASHGSYDICNTTCCHVYNPSTTASSYAVASIANTDNFILLTANNNVAQAEFAAETNDNCSPIQTSGQYCGQCGDGKFQKSVNGPPINSGGCYPIGTTDPVCTGQPNSGHPRGMCQRGSARWATGFTVINNTNMGAPHIFGTKTWQQMMAYYYPYYTLSQCNLTTPTPLPGAFTLTATSICNGNISQNKLEWTNALNASNYDVYRNGVLLNANVTGNQFLNNSVVAGTSYTYNVVAKNTTGNTNNLNGIVNVTTINCDPANIDSASIFVSPNPSNGNFIVHIKNNKNKNYTIAVFSSIGKKLYSMSSMTSTSNHQQPINIVQHAIGLYFVKIEIGGETVTKKILKR